MKTKIENRDAVKQYVEAGGEGIELTPKQQEFYDRWIYADELIRRNVGKKGREELANMIKLRWGVERCTAFQDLVNAEYVFVSSAPLNKKYFIQRRMEILERNIRNCAAAGDHKSASAYEKVLVKYVEIYPDYVPEQSPTTIIYNIQNNDNSKNVNVVNGVEQSLDDVLLAADDIIKQIEENDDY